ncbi:snoRNA-binding rRNA-processing protein imp4 [Gurleya vavrai]
MNRRKHREYLIRKEQEEKDKKIFFNKQILKQHIQSNTPLPHSLKKEAPRILQNILHDIEEDSIKPFNPLITTSRDPSDKLKQFVKRLSHIFNCNVLMRGKLTKEDLTDYISKSDFNMLIIVNESRGIPKSIVFLEYPYGPSFYFSLHNVKLGDFKFKGKAFFMAEDLDKNENLRVKEFMCRMFVGEGDKRVVLMANKESFICFRHYLDEESEGFDMKLYEIVRGTFEGGEKEFVYKPFLNTTRKKD